MSTLTTFLKGAMATSAVVYVGCGLINSPRLKAIKGLAIGVFWGAAAFYCFHNDKPTQVAQPRNPQPQQTAEQAIQAAQDCVDIFGEFLQAGNLDLQVKAEMVEKFEMAKKVCKAPEQMEAFALLEHKYNQLIARASRLEPKPKTPAAMGPKQMTPKPAISAEQAQREVEQSFANFEKFLQSADQNRATKDELATQMHNNFGIAQRVCSGEITQILKYKYDLLMVECAPYDEIMFSNLAAQLHEKRLKLECEYPHTYDYLIEFVTSQQRENIWDTSIQSHDAPTAAIARLLRLNPKTLQYNHPIFGVIDSKYSILLAKHKTPASVALKNHHEALSGYLDQHYKVHRVKGDGNCLFHSMHHLLAAEGRKTTQADLRTMIVRYMRNKDAYKQIIIKRINDDPMIQNAIPGFDKMSEEELVNKYLDNMEKDGIWGGKAELTAFCEIAQRPVMIWQQTKPINDVILLLPADNGPLRKKDPYLIKNSDEGHFEPLVPKK